MTRFILSTFVFLIWAEVSKAQQVPRQSIYLELGGAGLAYSVNYDFRFDKANQQSWGMRMGAGGWATRSDFSSESLLTIPVQVNRLFGKRKHFFEIGGGATFIHYRDRDTWNNSNFEWRNFNFILDSGDTPAFMGTLNMGYRKVPENGGFTFRANLTPIFNHNGFWPLFAGISFGYAF
ncbi:hypothetical protein [Lunatimonas salinarum]|uniref:hypothetical protein n=1 Tax=Lunatimonas salinarum TaxID=1774590 RepID=UPI001ADED29C|nr:hypothetical protein [Lunatimonas salinarum]